MKKYFTALGLLKKGNNTQHGVVLSVRRYRGEIKAVFDSGKCIVNGYYFPVIEYR